MKCKCGSKNLAGELITIQKTVKAVSMNFDTEECVDIPDMEPVVSEEVSFVPKFCFGCNKEITEKDVITTEQCPVCGSVVECLTEDGICEDCKAEKDELISNPAKLLELLKEKKERALAVVEEKAPKKKRTSKPKAEDVKVETTQAEPVQVETISEQQEKAGVNTDEKALKEEVAVAEEKSVTETVEVKEEKDIKSLDVNDMLKDLDDLDLDIPNNTGNVAF